MCGQKQCCGLLDKGGPWWEARMERSTWCLGRDGRVTARATRREQRQVNWNEVGAVPSLRGGGEED